MHSLDCSGYIAKPLQDYTPIFNAVMSWMSWFTVPDNSKLNFIITPEDTSTQLGSASTCPIDGGIKVYIQNVDSYSNNIIIHRETNL